jgi:tyrosyl-tRNA synthetase
MNNYISNLEWRGMVHNYVPGLDEQLNVEVTSGYLGVDLTASSLHIGNMAAIMLAKHLQLCGHKPIILLGGATSMAGDPSFKTTERKLMTREEIMYNQQRIEHQFSNFLDFSPRTSIAAEVLNNYDWFVTYGFLDFIRDVGKHITVNYMMSKDSVKKRLEHGLSFAEFSYQLMQGYDFYYLYKNKGVKLQLGGADQWGNLTTGVELIRKKLGADSFALTTPLITKQDGSKFGKSEGGANVWLDPQMTSPYKFYQFWLNLPDEDAKRFIKVFTLLGKEEIEQLCVEHDKMPHNHLLQSVIAKEVTTMVHSFESYQKAYKASKIIFGDDIELFNELDDDTIIEAFDGLPQITISKDLFIAYGQDPIGLLYEYTNGLVCQSKSEARRLIQGGGISINKTRITEQADIHLQPIKGRFMIIQKGKKSHYLVILD